MTVTNPLNQTAKHDSRTEKYNFISTENILDYFSDKGWIVGKNNHGKELVTYSKSKVNNGFQSHLIRLRNESFNVNDKYIPGIIIINSHDGSRALRLALGVFRFVCENGLIVGNSLEQYKISHKGFTYEKLDIALESLLLQIKKLHLRINDLSKTQLSDVDKEFLARKVMNSRLLEVNNVSGIDLESSLSSLRSEDNEGDAWTFLNILQEKLIRGGVDYFQQKEVKDEEGNILDRRVITRTTRPVTNINSVVQYNQLVWDEVYNLVHQNKNIGLVA